MAVFRYVVCDVFTDRALSGNQLAVFTDARKIPEGDLQGLAREMAYSETVFVYPANGDAHVRLRIFTPEAELPFAGHPVLGSAFVLGGPLQAETVRFETGVGVIPVQLEREGARIVFGRMTQPVPTWEPFAHTDELLAALGVDRSELPVEVYDNGLRYVYVVSARSKTWHVSSLIFGVSVRSPRFSARTGLAGSGRTWKTRMFAPADGVPEDPATGSAAGPLAVHLLRHGLIGSGEEVEISQGAELNRPSTLYATAWGTPEDIERVEVGGSAVVVARGEFQL